MTVQHPWAWCAMPACQRFFYVEEPGQRFCSRTCARGYEHLVANPERMERARNLARALDKTDIFDVARVNALLRREVEP